MNQCTAHSAALQNNFPAEQLRSNNKNIPKAENENAGKPADPCNDFRGVSAEAG